MSDKIKYLAVSSIPIASAANTSFDKCWRTVLRISIVASLFCVQSASADSLPQRGSRPVPSAAYDWSGFYGGVNVGGGFGNGQLNPQRSPVQTTTITVPGALSCLRRGVQIPIFFTGPDPTGLTLLNATGIDPNSIAGLGQPGFSNQTPGRLINPTRLTAVSVSTDAGAACGGVVEIFVPNDANGAPNPSGAVVSQGAPGGVVVSGPSTTTTTQGLVGPLANANGVDAGTLAALSALPGQRLNIRTRGVVGGGQIGYNYQTGRWVLGIEADLSASGVSGELGLGAFTARTALDWFGTFRGRFGYTFDRLLVYGTGGLAYGKISLDYSLGGISVGESRKQIGWTVGGGGEYALSDRVSVKAEYKYINFGSRTYLTEFGYDTLLQTDMHTAIIGLNYRF
jgi:opacity protein-like surface antigen